MGMLLETRGNEAPHRPLQSPPLCSQKPMPGPGCLFGALGLDSPRLPELVLVGDSGQQEIPSHSLVTSGWAPEGKCKPLESEGLERLALRTEVIALSELRTCVPAALGLHLSGSPTIANFTPGKGRRSTVLASISPFFREKHLVEQKAISGAFQACLLWSPWVGRGGRWLLALASRLRWQARPFQIALPRDSDPGEGDHCYVFQPQRWVLPAQGASEGEEVTAEEGAAGQENSASLLRPSIRITSEAQGHSPHASKMTIFSSICSVDPDSTQIPF